MSGKHNSLRFLRALVRHKRAELSDDGSYFFICAAPTIHLGREAVDALDSGGVVQREQKAIISTAETRNWIKRHLTHSQTPFAHQHQRLKSSADGRLINAHESPLARLAAINGKFLEPHHIEAGERFRRLFERAALRTRTTMSYAQTPAPKKGEARAHAIDLNDMSLDARKQIDGIFAALPGECANVVMDFCGFEKGLQQIEKERGWPRRSAKLVLRIALDQLAQHFGFLPSAVGQKRSGANIWRPDGARPTSLGECE